MCLYADRVSYRSHSPSVVIFNKARRDGSGGTEKPQPREKKPHLGNIHSRLNPAKETPSKNREQACGDAASRTGKTNGFYWSKRSE